MKLSNRPVLSPRCGSMSAHYEIVRLSAIRDMPLESEIVVEWS